jgi:hypothetical protein
LLLLSLVFLGLYFSFSLGVGGFRDDAHHVLLEGLLLKEEAVFVPDEVGGLHVEVVALHATFEESQDKAVVWVSGETESAAVLHEFLKLAGLVHAEFVNGNFLLLTLDVIIFLILRASGKSLPGERAAEEVQKHVANGLQIITTRLLVTNVSVDRGVTGGTSEVFAFAEGNVFSL